MENKMLSDSRDMRALNFHVHRVKRLAGSHEQAISFRATEADVAASLRQQDLPYSLSVPREDENTVVARADPTGASPDVAIHIGSDSIGTANNFPVLRLELHRSELDTFAQPLAIDNLPDFDVSRRLRIMRRAGVHHIELLVVLGEAKPVGLEDLVRHEVRFRRLRINSVNCFFDVKLALVAFVAHQAAVARIGKPDSPVGMHNHIVGCVKGLSLPFLCKHSDRAVVLITHDAASGVLAGNLAALEIEGVAVAVVRGVAKDAYVPVFG